jgi:hypothetical protein
MDLKDWDTAFGIAQKGLTIIGIIVGAIWAYFHYFRGRTYKPRLETSVSGKLLKQNETLLLVANIRIRNVGLSKIDIKQKGSGMRIIGLEKKENVKTIEKYEGVRLKTVSIFNKHSWIEPGETIEDVHTLILPDNEYFGLKLDVRLITKKITWRFSSVERFSELTK